MVNPTYLDALEETIWFILGEADWTPNATPIKELSGFIRTIKEYTRIMKNNQGYLLLVTLDRVGRILPHIDALEKKMNDSRVLTAMKEEYLRYHPSK